MRDQHEHLGPGRVRRKTRADAEVVERRIERGHPYAKPSFAARPRCLRGEETVNQLHRAGRQAGQIAQRRADARNVVAMHCVFNRGDGLVTRPRREIVQHEGRLQPVEHGAAGQAALRAARQPARHRLDPAHHRCRRRRGREPPAGFVEQQYLPTLKQRAGAPRHQRVERNQTNIGDARCQPRAHLRRHCTGFSFERAGSEDAHRRKCGGRQVTMSGRRGSRLTGGPRLRSI